MISSRYPLSTTISHVWDSATIRWSRRNTTFAYEIRPVGDISVLQFSDVGAMFRGGHILAQRDDGYGFYCRVYKIFTDKK